MQEITREVGCLARKSVVQVGNRIFFLSDNGIYAVTFQDLYNLRGASIPLSEAIEPTIKRINKDYAYNSVAIYHDNRYYISVPLDDSTVNNAILVYNFLNDGWESIDTVQAEGWNIENLIRAGAGSLNKKYNSFEIQAESSESNDSDISISFEAENPDSVSTLNSLSELLGSTLSVAEDASVRGRIGNIRGYGGQFTLTPTQGRPKVRAIKVSSQLTDLSINSKE